MKRFYCVYLGMRGEGSLRAGTYESGWMAAVGVEWLSFVFAGGGLGGSFLVLTGI